MILEYGKHLVVLGVPAVLKPATYLQLEAVLIPYRLPVRFHGPKIETIFP